MLPNNQGVKIKEKGEVVLNILKIFISIGETMPSKIAGIRCLLGAIDLVVNALDDTIISDEIKIYLQKCKSIEEHESIKKACGTKVMSWY